MVRYLHTRAWEIFLRVTLSALFRKETAILILEEYNRDVVVLVQSLSWVQLFGTSWTAAHQAFLSFTVSQCCLKLKSIESVMLSNHLIRCCPLLLEPSIFPSSRVFLISQIFASGGQSIRTSASLSILPMNTQGWFPLGLTDLISLWS